jgi:hypothetical protein
MIKRLILLVLFLGLIFPGFADQMTGQVDKLFAQWDKKNSPGCALAIIKDGKIIYKRGYGMADLERDVPITPGSVFDIASTSKQFLAMSIALLAEEGKLSLGYFPKKDGGYGIAVYLFNLVGDGGLLTSVEELFLWDQNFYHNKLGKQGQKLIKQMHTTGTLNDGKKLEYAFALGIGEYNGLKIVHHAGARACYRSELLRFPGQQFSVICLANLAGFNPTVMAKKVADIYLADHFKETPINKPASAKPKIVKLSESELKDKTGVYRNPQNGSIWHIIYEKKKLKVRPYQGFGFTIVPLSPLQFQAVDTPVDIWLTFLKPDKSNVKAMNVEFKIGSREPVVCEHITLAAPSLDQLKEYTGNYYSEELDVTYKLFVKEDKLFFQLRYITDGFHLEPTLKDEFLVMGANVRFNRDTQGKISGFTVNTKRVQNIGFKKK